MQIVRIERLIDRGPFSSSGAWREIESHITTCMKALEWPAGAGQFLLRDESGKKRGQGSGVKPIKDGFMICLKGKGWEAPKRLDFATIRKPGAIDAAFRVGQQYFALEWETGNISSSHRSLNKMTLGMLKGPLIGGVLIVPTRKMYKFLTDRVGNYEELEPLFDVWRRAELQGLLAVVAIEHDAVGKDIPRIPKGTNGRALI